MARASKKTRCALDVFGAATRSWFEQRFQHPTAVQQRGWPLIAAGKHALLVAPTGSGKTLAAFLWALDSLSQRGTSQREGVRVLYVSPLKALAYDVERNLRAPRRGIEGCAQQLGEPLQTPRVALRSGDTSRRERRLQARHPAEILVTTPESLYLLLGSQARETLRTVETVIVDEVHALAPTKRGVHLALSLERLSALTGADPQRIGLSATARPVARVAHFLGGDRDVAIVDASCAPLLDLQVWVPVADMTRPEVVPSPTDEVPPAATAPTCGGDPHAGSPDDGGAGGPHRQPKGMWSAIVPRLVALIRQHRTTIIFVNSRGLCERLVKQIDESAGEPLARAHHGSIAHPQRREVEALLKQGHIAAIVATSSLELGIDMGSIDLVVLVESPGAVARGLQRVGRAGHGVGEISRGRIFPKHRGDLLESAVVAARMRAGELEPLRLPQNPLDVLAQQLVAMCALAPRALAELRQLVHRCASYHDLPEDAFLGVLDMLSGRYPSNALADLRPRLLWDRERDQLSPRRGTRTLAIINGGTIADRGLFRVQLGENGPRIGELDEEMVHETQPGHVLTLGASSWRVERITRDAVHVVPAPGQIGRMPFWRGDGPGRPIELGQAIGALVRLLRGKTPTQARAHLTQHCGLDEYAATNLLRYLDDQFEAVGAIPDDRTVLIERFRDELGDDRICILTPFGARVHAPWALALQAQLSSTLPGYQSQMMWNDDGICLRVSNGEQLPGRELLLPDPAGVEQLVVEQLGQSAMFASHFRENAARALLLPRRRPGARTPLWQQRLRAQQLLAAVRPYPAFPIMVETYRQCLQDVFDMPSLKQILGRIRSRQLDVHECTSRVASPFARSLVFAYVANYLYEGDAPVAERRAHALSLDRALLRRLLGQAPLRELLDADVIARLQRELQCLTPDRQARDADDLHHVLRRLGALSRHELNARCQGDAAAMLAQLSAQRRALPLTLAGTLRIAAVEDAAHYRDALGCALPSGIPKVFLEAREAPLLQLLQRYAKTHTPFTEEAFAKRFGLTRAAVLPAFATLLAQGQLVEGQFLPAHSGTEYCDADVLRRIKRRTLARLRGEVEAVDGPTLARFLSRWHGVDTPQKGLAHLEQVLQQLEGMPLSYRELERTILPARVKDFHPRMLDKLGAMGVIVWVGRGALGRRDGRVAVYRRSHVHSLVDPPASVVGDDGQPLHTTAGSAAAVSSDVQRCLLDALTQRGACFFRALESDCHQRLPEQRLTQRDVRAALWDLVWQGLVTNDTFQALRAYALGTPKRRRRGSGDASVAGRWSLVGALVGNSDNVTERAHALARALLSRHGMVSRATFDLETIPGGFRRIYQVLRAMEEAGHVRRGYFAEGIGGAQFALAGAVDRLRGLRQPRPDGPPLVLAAVDPATPYGWMLPWPPHPAGERVLKRASGAVVVMREGELLLYLDSGGKRLFTFGDDERRLGQALAALRERLATRSRKTIRIDEIDGEPALRSARGGWLREQGFGSDHRGFTIERRV